MGYGAKFAIFVACVSFVMYMAGFTSPFSALLFMGTEIDWVALMINTVLSPMGALGILLGGALFVGLVITRSPLIDYVLKISLIVVVSNIFVLPIRELILTNTVLPVPLNYFFVIILNIMLISSILSFLSGDGW